MSELKCRRHPKYQAKRPPRADCSKCRVMWRLAQEERKGQTP